MRRLIGAVGALAVLAMPARGQAQELCKTSFKTPPVGSWAEWRMTEGADSSITSRMAVVGSEQRDGKTLTRLEMTSQGRRGPIIMQVLISGWPYGAGETEEAVFKMGDRPAMKVPQAMLSRIANHRGSSASGWMRGCEKMQVVGSEKVTVPAGTFSTTHYRNAQDGSDVWIDKDLPFALVKLTDSSAADGEKSTMELSASGTGAKSAITETPQEMPGMGRGMPGGRSNQ